MRTLSLTTTRPDWRALAEELRRGGAPVRLEVNGQPIGILLAPVEAERVVAHYAAREQTRPGASTSGAALTSTMPTYLELLREDPTLVPVLDGQPLRFMTMMNSSYVDPQQFYQFDNPRTGEVHVYRADELQQAIGRPFARVEFIPIGRDRFAPTEAGHE